MTKLPAALPNIFEYENYRTFLHDTYKVLKARDKKISFRYFARLCGFSSHSFLQFIMQGKSNLSHESSVKVAKAFKLNQEQSLFFQNLVQLNQATTSEERHHFAKEILKSQGYRKYHPLRESQYQYYASWYFTVIRELVGLPDFIENAQQIADRMIPKISAEEVENAIKSLLKLGLLERDENGKLIQTETVVTTGPEVSSAYVANWHKHNMKKAAESIDRVAREKRDISAVTLGLNKENMKMLKQMVAHFQKEVVELANQQSNKDQIYQVNIQIFPLTESPEESDS